jgi:hypothetical protein
MSEKLFKEDGSPFATINAAKSRQTILRKEGIRTNPVEVEGGFALNVLPDKRPPRAKLGKRNVLTAKVPEGYRGRVVNDTGTKIEDFKAAGWMVYTGDDELGDERTGDAHKIGSAVSKPVGGGITGVLMIKPEDEFQEDYKERQDDIDRWEKQMKLRTKIQGQYGKIRIGTL